MLRNGEFSISQSKNEFLCWESQTLTYILPQNKILSCRNSTTTLLKKIVYQSNEHKNSEYQKIVKKKLWKYFSKSFSFEWGCLKQRKTIFRLCYGVRFIKVFWVCNRAQEHFFQNSYGTQTPWSKRIRIWKVFWKFQCLHEKNNE